MQYGNKERAIASVLSRFPRLKSVLKAIYQRYVYLLHTRSRYRSAVVFAGAEIKESFDYGNANRKSSAHWFGYYDKSPWNSDGRLYIGHTVGNDAENCRIVVKDLRLDSVVTIGETASWNFQQGAMTTWTANDPYTLVYNRIESGILGSQWVTLAPETLKWTNNRFVPWPIQTVHPNGGRTLTLNYRRLHRLRPEYGYACDVENFSANQPDESDGIWRVNVATDTAELVVSIDQLRRWQPVASMTGAEHKVNHIMYSPSGNRFVFMHRWLHKTGKYSRLILGKDGHGIEEMRVLMDERVVSHYSWKNDNELIVWGRHNGHDGYYLVDVIQQKPVPLSHGALDKYGDGHPSFSPNGRFVITDTYPDKARTRTLLLLDIKTGELKELGRFFAPWKFNGERRCDLHPRWSPDGTKVSIDSAHEGIRRTYEIEVPHELLT